MSDVNYQEHAIELLKIQNQLSHRLCRAASLDEALNLCMDAALATTRMDVAGIYMVDQDGGIDMLCHKGVSDEIARAVRHFDREAPRVQRIMMGLPIYFGTDRNPFPKTVSDAGEFYKSLAVIPFKHNDTVIGCMNVGSRSLDEIPDALCHTLENIANLIGGFVGRIRTEERLKESEERFRRLSENLPDILMRWKPGYGLDYINPAFDEILGRNRKDYLGNWGSFMSIVHPNDVSLIGRSFQEMGKGRKDTMTVEYRIFSKSGDIVWLEVLWKPIWDDRGALESVEAIARDITERKNSELENRRLQEQLVHSQKMEAIGTLAGGIAHDFNNILGVIGGTTELMLRKAPHDAPFHESLERIDRSTRRAKDLTMKLLTFARKEPLSLRPAVVNDIVLDVIDMLKNTVSQKIRLGTVLSEGMKNICVDANQIAQAVLNICINACDAMPEGGELTFTTSMGRHDSTEPEDKYCVISISDTGAGIAPELKDRIFEPFFTTKGKEKGSGLGLSICHGIIVNHRGFISVDSEAGRGATFKLYIPACDSRVTDVNDEKKSDANHGLQGTILVIDDDIDFGQVMMEILQAEGFRVYACASGKEAITLYEQKGREIDIVFLDMMLPEMDGNEIFRALKGIDPGVKVVLCSGYSRAGKATELLRNGAVAFLQKPFDIDEIREAVEAILTVK